LAEFDVPGFLQHSLLNISKELIKVRGFQVAPPEIEAVLLDHPQIIDAAVIGIKSADESSEYPRGYVVKRPGPEGDKLTHEDIHSHVNERLIHYKQLAGGLVFVPDVSI
jgi:acyl-coenzyme A synthetase/AMP-(fatty) acid ligase